MLAIVANLSQGVRRDRRGGREYVVAPVTLLVSGVLHGSRGPLYYPPEEINKSVSAWNGMPIVVYHPTVNGLAVSARDPDILASSGVGFVYRNRADEGKLSAEAWLDVEDVKRVDTRVLEALESSKPVEVSTGLNLDTETAPEGAVHNGVSYLLVARNYRPDHLAILPDLVGACSVSDGCGLLVNESGSLSVDEDSVLNPYPNEHAARVMDPSMMRKDSFRRKQIAPGVSVILGKKEGSDTMEIQAYRFDRRKFTAEEAKVWLEEHKAKHMSFHPATGEMRNESADSAKEVVVSMSAEQRKSAIDWLVANCDCWKSAGDKEILEKVSDDKLTALKQHSEKEKQREIVANAARAGFEDKQGNQFVYNEATGKWEEKVKPAPPSVPTTPRPMTYAEWMSSAPAEVQSAVRNAVEIENREKFALVTRLISNVSGDEARKQHSDFLLTKSLDELRRLSALLPPTPDFSVPTPLYTVAGGGGQVQNTAFDEDDVLSMPVIEWGKK